MMDIRLEMWAIAVCAVVLVVWHSSVYLALKTIGKRIRAWTTNTDNRP